MALRSVKKVVDFWNTYERALSGGALLVGFSFDLFLAKRPDSLVDNVLLISYLFIAASLIIILNIHGARRRDVTPKSPPLFLLLVLQFCFGGLSSNLLVLYGKSGTLAGSGLFILLLVGMLVGNEFLKTRYAQLRFNIVVFYMLLLTYLIIAVPTFIFHSVGTLVFLASGFLSLVLIAGFLSLVYVAVFRGRERGAQLYEVSVLVGLMFLFFNGLYFLQIIPPVPLSLKNIGVYHSISILPQDQRTDGNLYSAAYEPAPWFVFWNDTSGTYTLGTEGQAVCFSSVFAPAKLSAPIFHHWERFNDQTGKWETASRVSFPINGGREEGYRGFTLADVSPGRWRCDVETQAGALIGRSVFTVKQGNGSSMLSTKML